MKLLDKAYPYGVGWDDPARSVRANHASNYLEQSVKVMAADEKSGSPRRNVAMVGLAAFAILGTLVAVFALIAGVNPFEPKITATTYFTNSLGLKSGAAVNLDGVTVGIVKRVELSSAPEHRKTPVLVTMRLKTKFLSGIHTDSLASLTSMGALADTVIDIDSQHATGPPIQDGAEIATLNMPTVLNFKSTQDTMNSVHQLMDKLDPLVDRVEKGNGSIGKLMSDPNLTKEATDTIAKVKQVTAKINGRDNTAGKLLNDPDLMRKFAAVGTDVAGLQASATKLTNGPLNANLTSMQSEANQLSTDISQGHGAVALMTHNQAFKDQMSQFSANTKNLSANLDKGNGTAGKFLHDQQVQTSLTKLQTESSALATMIRQNPKQYLTIKVRVF